MLPSVIGPVGGRRSRRSGIVDRLLTGRRDPQSLLVEPAHTERLDRKVVRPAIHVDDRAAMASVACDVETARAKARHIAECQDLR